MIVDDREKLQPAPPAPRAGGTAARVRREITSAELFGDGREIRILHADEVYTLRHTNKGKLILTK